MSIIIFNKVYNRSKKFFQNKNLLPRLREEDYFLTAAFIFCC
ncbi:hypothetical protein GCWU000321_01752 [Dialister invisus DSM 15470]|uniref:Uncharacterized protein n=1 Tax=Dialister invisus DSM 15470 TaxID=592028 RepID=C9LQC0_9FIRM|nr:hypothetical protein GCWU000321_01752 [Dialister invisus DSM 15470]